MTRKPILGGLATVVALAMTAAAAQGLPLFADHMGHVKGDPQGQVAFDVEVVGVGIVIRIEHVVPDIERMAANNRMIDVNRLPDIGSKQLSGAQMPSAAAAA